MNGDLGGALGWESGLRALVFWEFDGGVGWLDFLSYLVDALVWRCSKVKLFWRRRQGIELQERKTT